MSEQTESTDFFDVTEESISEILDVDTATDTPQTDSSTETEDVALTSDSAESETPEQETTEETEEETDAPDETETTEETTETPDSDLLVESKDKDGKPVVYDFASAPKEMREQFKTSNKIVNAFIREDAETVLSELETLSPSSYLNLTQNIVNECAKANPQGWAEYLVKAEPAIVAKTLLDAHKTDTDDFSDANPALLAELFRIYREDSTEGDDLRFAIETRDSELSSPPPPKLEPAEKAELERLRTDEKKKAAERETHEIQQLYTDVWTYLEDSAVVPVIEKLGLMPSKTDTPEQLREKKRIIDTLPNVLDKALLEDAETAKDYEKLIAKVNARDRAGAMALTPAILKKIESETLSYLGYIANARTQAIKQKFTAAKTPPKVLASAGANAAPIDKAKPLGEMLESMSDEDLLRSMGQI